MVELVLVVGITEVWVTLWEEVIVKAVVELLVKDVVEAENDEFVELWLWTLTTSTPVINNPRITATDTIDTITAVEMFVIPYIFFMFI